MTQCEWWRDCWRRPEGAEFPCGFEQAGELDKCDLRKPDPHGLCAKHPAALQGGIPRGYRRPGTLYTVYCKACVPHTADDLMTYLRAITTGETE